MFIKEKNKTLRKENVFQPSEFPKRKEVCETCIYDKYYLKMLEKEHITTFYMEDKIFSEVFFNIRAIL